MIHFLQIFSKPVVKKWRCHYHCLFLLLSISVPGFAVPDFHDSTVTISDHRDFFPVNHAAFFLKDKKGTLTIGDVTKSNTGFEPIPKDVYYFNEDGDVTAYWAKFTVRNLTNATLKDIICLHPGLDSVTVYIFNPDHSVARADQNAYQKTSDRPFFISQEILFPTAIQPGTTKVYIRIVNRTLWSRDMSSLIISIAEEKSFLNYFLEVRFLQGASLGMLLLILVFHLFIYIFFRDTTYLVFLINIFFTLVYLMLRKNLQLEFDFLSPLYPALVYFHDPAGTLISLTAIWFSQLFLNTRKMDPVMHRIMNGLMIVQGLVAVCMITFQFLILMNVLSIYLGFISAIFMIIASVRSYQRGNRLALYVFFGFIFLAAVPLIYIFPMPNYLHFKSNEADIHYFGEAIRAMIFGVGVADRFYLLKKEVARNQVEKEQFKFEKEKQLQDEKERISRDLHDNIGSQLAVLSLELSLLSTRYTDNPQLSAAKDNANFIIGQLRDTVWAIERDKVTMEDIEGKLVNMIWRYRKNISNIEFRVDMPDDVKPIKLMPSQAINLFRILQEAVQNGIRHSGGSHIRIRIYANHAEQILGIEVTDNGSGFKYDFNDDNTFPHYGLRNMKKRSEEMAGVIEIKNGGDKGTTVSLLFPYS